VSGLRKTTATDTPKHDAMPEEKPLSPREIARRRDETIKRMIATPPKTLGGKAKRTAKKMKA